MTVSEEAKAKAKAKARQQACDAEAAPSRRVVILVTVHVQRQ
jgi:hypothetical protein